MSQTEQTLVGATSVRHLDSSLRETERGQGLVGGGEGGELVCGGDRASLPRDGKVLEG